MTAPDPSDIHTQGGYDKWLNETAEEEIEEFLDVYEEPFHIDQFISWIDESPVFADDDWAWARLYDSVYDNSYNLITEMEIVIPAENPWHKLAVAVRDVVSRDLTNRMALRLEDRDYEVER